MADANTDVSTACYHCHHSLTRPDIELRASSIPATLGCNGLAPSQIAADNETVCATQADISELDSAIGRLRAATKELEDKQKALLNPITRLPAEVLSQIFQQCVIVTWLGRTTESFNKYLDLDKTPLRLAGVSRHWRNVALNSPRLWSNFSLLLRPKDTKRHIELATMWFSRSGNSPLSIHLTTLSEYRDPMRKLMRIFASNCGKWRYIYLRLPLPMLRICMSSVKSRVPMLEVLSFDLWSHQKVPLVPLDALAHTPRLRDLSIGPLVASQSLIIPWDQPRDLSIVSERHNGGPQRALNF